MRACLLVLACLAHHAHARRVQKNTDEQNEYNAIAALLFANPLLSRGALRTAEPLRTKGPLMQLQRTDIGQAQQAAMGRVAPDLDRQGIRPEPILIQGNTLKTWSYASPAVDRVQVVLTTEGRPLDADIELWQGPDNTPVKMRVYSENGANRPFSAVVETPRAPNTIAIRNIGQIEFPLAAFVIANDVDEPISDFAATSMTVQGGALRTFPFDPTVESVEIMLKTDGRPLNARIELLQGPNNNKQVIELYTEDGLDRPFFAIVETIGSGNVVRLVNTGPVEFPMTATVQPHLINENVRMTDAVIGGDGPVVGGSGTMW